MKFICKWLWRLAGRSPEWGNRVMDILGPKRYEYIMRHHD